VAEDEEIHCLGVGCGWKWFRWLGFGVCGYGRRGVGVKDAGVGAGQGGCGGLGVRLRIVHGLRVRLGHGGFV
jgi:hypothetical protein